MSTPKTTPWKTIAVGFMILTVAFGGVAAAAVVAMTNVTNDKTSLQSLYDHLKTTDQQNNQTITVLNAKVSSLQTQLQANYTEVQTLNGQIATDNTLITHLQAELQANYTDVQSLTTQITQLQAKITALQGQITMDQQTITELQNELASIPRFTLVSGTLKVTVSAANCDFLGFNLCTPVAVVFNNQLSSIAFNNTNVFSYSLYLPSATTFNVQLVYAQNFIVTTIYTCTPIPSTITTPSGTATLTQDFFC